MDKKKQKDWLVYIPYPDHSPFGPKPNLNGGLTSLSSGDKAPQPVKVPTGNSLREKSRQGFEKTQPALR